MTRIAGALVAASVAAGAVGAPGPADAMRSVVCAALASPQEERPPPPIPVPGQTETHPFDDDLIDLLRERLYFNDLIKARLEEKATLVEEGREAAARARLDAAHTAVELKRVDARDVRALLIAKLAPADDPGQVRVLVREDLLRDCAPKAGELPRKPELRKRTVEAAKRLLRGQMELPGGDAIWGSVDREVDAKMRGILASRSGRPEKRPWCELALWTMLASDQAARCATSAAACSKWLADSKAAPSNDFVAVQAIAEYQVRHKDAAALAFATLKKQSDATGTQDAKTLVERVGHTIGANVSK